MSSVHVERAQVFLDYNANVVVGDLGLAKRVAVSSSDLNEQGACTEGLLRVQLESLCA